MRIVPKGSRIIVRPLPTEDFTTDGGIAIVQNELRIAEVIEVSDDYKELFKEGDTVLYANNAGLGQYYKGKQMLWLDCRAPNQGGDIWAVIKS